MSEPTQRGSPDDAGGDLGQRLPCGANLDDLLEQVADGHAAELTVHQSRCVHCQAALTELASCGNPSITCPKNR